MRRGRGPPPHDLRPSPPAPRAARCWRRRCDGAWPRRGCKPSSPRARERVPRDAIGAPRLTHTVRHGDQRWRLPPPRPQTMDLSRPGWVEGVSVRQHLPYRGVSVRRRSNAHRAPATWAASRSCAPSPPSSWPWSRPPSQPATWRGPCWRRADRLPLPSRTCHRPRGTAPWPCRSAPPASVLRANGRRAVWSCGRRPATTVVACPSMPPPPLTPSPSRAPYGHGVCTWR